jgi:hypothetical protein
VRRALPIAVALLAAGCGSSKNVLISPGHIGPLRLDRSTRAEVIAFVGKPDAQRHAAEYQSTPYLALGYGCSAKQRDDAFPLLETPNAGRTGPSCVTVFWVNQRTGRLGDFYTSSPRYEERRGVLIGMKTAEAERLLRRRADVGCEENIYLGTREAPMTVAFDGGTPRKVRGSYEQHLIGGHVYAFALHGRQSDIGIFDCL